jgi:hypothetical protein
VRSGEADHAITPGNVCDCLPGSGRSVDGSIAASRVAEDPDTKPSRGPGNVRAACRSGSAPTSALDRVAGATARRVTTAAAAPTETSTPVARTKQIRHTPGQKSRHDRRNLYRWLHRRYYVSARALLPTIAIALLTAGAAAGAIREGRMVSTARVSLQLPAGWQGRISKTPACDPERLIVASSGPIHIGRNGQLSPPPAGSVVVVLLEDRYRQDRPVGDLRRPQHFSVTWKHLVHIKPSCGLPASPGYMRYVKTHGRYLGFIVYPGPGMPAATRTATVTLMDSLRINP